MNWRVIPLAARLEMQIEPEPNSGCWLWIGTLSDDGYPKTKVNGIAGQWIGAPLSGDVSLTARCYFPDRRKRDAGNYRKAITDALSGVCYADDAQLASETWNRMGYDKMEPRIEVLLYSQRGAS